jgi:hypothetical protein
LTASVFAQSAEIGSPDAGTSSVGRHSATASISVPENHEARKKLEDLFYAPVAALIDVQERVLQQTSAGSRVKFETRGQNGHLYYLFQNEEDSSFSVDARGSYIIKRDSENGRFVQIKIFYRSEPGCFVRLFPDKHRTSMDVYLYGIAVDQGVLLPVEFEQFLILPFTKVIQLSGSTVRWERLLYRRWDPVEELAFSHVQSIRRMLPSLSDNDDGALDADQNYVFIESGLHQGDSGGLNCSGFAKWISDGFYYGLTGRYLDIDPLKEKHLDLRGNRWSLRFEEERDPYFGLDWSRNLATALWQARGYRSAAPEDFDVRQVEYLQYREDVGYPLKDLKMLLFLETTANPGHFYIGSLNREFGTQPVLRQHFHMVVLFPYFTPSGSFRVAVFDRTRETTLDGTIKRYSGAYVHLVRLPVGDSFLPPQPLN